MAETRTGLPVLKHQLYEQEPELRLKESEVHTETDGVGSAPSYVNTLKPGQVATDRQKLLNQLTDWAE